MELMEQFISATNSQPFPRIGHGDGIYVWDAEGKRYIDGSSGAVVANIGHNNTRVRNAMLEQAAKISFAYGRAWKSDAQEILAEKLLGLSGLGFDSCFFVSGGTEAIETAVKLARQVAYARGDRKRRKVVSRLPSYHGSTLAMLGITGDADFAAPFEGMFVSMPKVPAPLSYRTPGGMSAEAYAQTCIDALERCIIEEGPETILAFVMEPVGGTSTGALVAPNAYYSQVRGICDRYGIFLIFDEIMSGAGRTGKFLAAHHWPDCIPDLVALAKGISGGYTPLGAVLARSDMILDLRRMGGFLHGHTYAANPLSCAIASAVLDELVEKRLVKNAASMGPLLKARIESLAPEGSIVGDIRGLGLLMALEIVADRQSKRMFPFEANAIATIRSRCAEAGLMLLSRRTSGGRFGEWLMICPPLTISDEQVTEYFTALHAGLRAFEKG